jgi:hypothetical protein
VQRLTRRHNTDGCFAELTQQLLWVPMTESPFPPGLESRTTTHALPLLSQQLLIFSTSTILHASEAEHPERDKHPTASTKAHGTLAEHEATEPEPRLEETKKEETGDYGHNDDDPYTNARGAVVIVARIV